MCGRFTLFDSSGILSKEFGVTIPFDLPPRYNIAPTQRIPAVRIIEGGGVRELALLRWGLIPSWAKDPAIGNRMINARAETVSEKPVFRGSFRSRRCLVPASGFYEWRKRGATREPYHISPPDRIVMAIAGLWDRWEGPDGFPVDSCTLLTTEANELIAPLHDRMPVIIGRENYDAWLDPSAYDPAALRALLVPFPPDRLAAHPVSRRVNDPSIDDPSLLDLFA